MIKILKNIYDKIMEKLFANPEDNDPYKKWIP